MKTAAGAALVFAKQGVAALDAAGGRANAVDWEKVEADTTTEAEVDLGFSTVETLAAVLEHSPKYAGVDPAEVAEVLAEVAELERREASPDDFSPRPKKRFGPAPR